MSKTTDLLIMSFPMVYVFPWELLQKKDFGIISGTPVLHVFFNSFKLSSYMQSTVSLYGCAFDPLNGLTFVCGRIFDRDTLIFI